MKRKRSIQFKAAFLIIVFSMNTIIGFACAVGLDMGFNSTHHHDEEATEVSVHVHSGGKKHIHHIEATKHRDEADNDHHKTKESKDNCCKGKVIKFNEIDKSASNSLNATINPAFFSAFVFLYSDISVLYPSYINSGIKYFVRSHHPPIPDIRIHIQSFQI